MPTINQMSHGVDEAGVTDYIDKLKAVVITEAATAVKDISSIRTVCEENWEGEARKEFLELLQKDANHVADQYQALYDALFNEIKNVMESMQQFDRVMMD